MLGEGNGPFRPSSGVLSIPQKKIRLIDSEALGEKIVLVDCDSDIRDATGLYPDQVVYTHAEVGRMLGFTPETLREVHGLKKAFHGRISFVASPAEPVPAPGTAAPPPAAV